MLDSDSGLSRRQGFRNRGEECGGGGVLPPPKPREGVLREPLAEVRSSAGRLLSFRIVPRDVRSGAFLGGLAGVTGAPVCRQAELALRASGAF